MKVKLLRQRNKKPQNSNSILTYIYYKMINKEYIVKELSNEKMEKYFKKFIKKLEEVLSVSDLPKKLQQLPPSIDDIDEILTDPIEFEIMDEVAEGKSTQKEVLRQLRLIKASARYGVDFLYNFNLIHKILPDLLPNILPAKKALANVLEFMRDKSAKSNLVKKLKDKINHFFNLVTIDIQINQFASISHKYPKDYGTINFNYKDRPNYNIEISFLELEKDLMQIKFYTTSPDLTGKTVDVTLIDLEKGIEQIICSFPNIKQGIEFYEELPEELHILPWKFHSSQDTYKLLIEVK